MPLNTEVSFRRKMTFATREGTETAMACGRMTLHIVCTGVIPRLSADSFWIGSTVSRPERKASVM